jgi:predicted nucleotidyltransferase component of viral defense system
MIPRRELKQQAMRQMALTTPYVQPFTVTCMTLEEILAEKIRATLMRHAARDYLDLWLLLQREDVTFSALPDLIRAKLDTVDRPYEPQSLWAESDVLRRVWNDDLRQLMNDVPPFDTMFRELQALFEERMPRTL